MLMASRHRKRTRDRVFIAGDRADLAAIQQVLAVLADDAYGQVYIEVLDEREIGELTAPARVTVTWLPRVTRPSAMRPLAFAAHGEALSAAIAGWVGEWMPATAHPAEGSARASDQTVMWIGCAGSAHMAALYDVLQARFASLNALESVPAA